MMPFITIGNIQLQTYLLMYSLAFLLFTGLTLREVRDDEPLSARRRFGLLACALAFMVGLILPGLAQSLVESLRTGQPMQAPQSRVYYGLAAAVLVAAWVNRGSTLVNLYRDLDRFIPYFPLVYAVARLGCLAAGCCGGSETDSWLGVYAPDEDGHWADRYPAQLMSGGIQLALFAFFTWLVRWRKNHQSPAGFMTWLNRPGLIFYGYVLAFCLERFSLDFLRADYRPIWGPLSLPQLLMLAGLLAAVMAIMKLKPESGVKIMPS